jgi:hypothetical protein
VRVARLRDEYYSFLESPKEFVGNWKNASPSRADLFSFVQEVSDPKPKYEFHQEWDVAAVVSLSSYEHWWKKQINDKTRNMVRKAQKSGVEIREVGFDQDLARAIHVIYNESPYRQGRAFKHYGKDVSTIQREHATFLDRSRFFGAFFKGQMIGFFKLVRGRGVSSLMNIISLISHRDKAPTNALIAKAVEICATDRIPLLQYGTGMANAIGDFKKHHAFEEVWVPRYFVPLNRKGALFLKLGFHRTLKQRIPEEWRTGLIHWRNAWTRHRLSKHSPAGL